MTDQRCGTRSVLGQCLPCHDRGYDTTAAIVPR